MAVAAVTVYPSTTRIESADTTTGWSNDGGGGGVSVEGDIFYQGTGAASRKVSTTPIGRAYTHGSNIDMDGTPATTAHVLLKINATNYAALQARSTPSFWVKIGSSSSAYYQFYLFGNDNYPATGGFQFIAVAPSVSGYRDTTQGSPNLSQVTYFSLRGDFSAGSKAENLVIDAIDVGLGLACVGGDGVSADATFDDFVSTDEGTSGNRWGYVTTNQGVLFCIGELAIGRNSTPSAVATEFTDSGKTLVWRNGLVTTGFNRLLVDMGSASTVITMSNCSFGSQGQVDNDGDRGYTTTEDSRTVFQATGTSGTSDFNSCVFSNFASFALNSATTFDACVVDNCGAITTNTSVLTDCSVSNSPATAAVVVANLSELSNVNFTSAGTGHAVDLGTISTSPTMTWNCDDSGYAATDGSTGNETILVSVNSGQTLTINVGTGRSTPTIKNDGLGTVTVVAGQVTTTVIVKDGSVSPPATITDETVNVLVEAASGGPLSVGTDIIKGFTDTSGEISDTRSLVSDQPITGWARRSSAGNAALASGYKYFKTSLISGTIDSGNGLTITVLLQPDE